MKSFRRHKKSPDSIISEDAVSSINHSETLGSSQGQGCGSCRQDSSGGTSSLEIPEGKSQLTEY